MGLVQMYFLGSYFIFGAYIHVYENTFTSLKHTDYQSVGTFERSVSQLMFRR